MPRRPSDGALISAAEDLREVLGPAPLLVPELFRWWGIDATYSVHCYFKAVSAWRSTLGGATEQLLRLSSRI